jgi:hypothetical protein
MHILGLFIDVVLPDFPWYLVHTLRTLKSYIYIHIFVYIYVYIYTVYSKIFCPKSKSYAKIWHRVKPNAKSKNILIEINYFIWGS